MSAAPAPSARNVCQPYHWSTRPRSFGFGGGGGSGVAVAVPGGAVPSGGGAGFCASGGGVVGGGGCCASATPENVISAVAPSAATGRRMRSRRVPMRAAYRGTLPHVSFLDANATP